MARSRLPLLLLFLMPLAGCTQLVAVTNSSDEVLPAKIPEKPDSEEPAAEVAPKVPVGTVDSSQYPPVLLSSFHAQWCTRQVGQSFPDVSLPKLGGGKLQLSSLMGKQATLVLFWKQDRWMSRTALEDVQQLVVDKLDATDVAVVGIPVELSPSKVRRQTTQAKADFTQLLDNRGTALAEVGSVALPRLYVLDDQGTIVWFDIEYSESTRRELLSTITALTNDESLAANSPANR